MAAGRVTVPWLGAVGVEKTRPSRTACKCPAHHAATSREFGGVPQRPLSVVRSLSLSEVAVEVVVGVVVGVVVAEVVAVVVAEVAEVAKVVAVVAVAACPMD